MIDVAIVIKTERLLSDDRILKQVRSLCGRQLRAFVLYNSFNTEAEVIEGLDCRRVELLTRRFLPRRVLPLLKSFEFWIRLQRELKKARTVWIHEGYTLVFACLLNHPRIIWDLHELPVRKPESYIWRFLLRLAERNCMKVVHANKYRLDFLFSHGYFVDRSKHTVLRNFPDSYYLGASEILPDFPCIDWAALRARGYIYLQGLSSKARYPFNSLVACLKASELQVVLVGKLENETRLKLMNEYPGSFGDRIIEVGFVDQIKTSALIRHARYSIVLYEPSSPNNFYCDPNRLFQALAHGVPCVVGANPSMADNIRKGNVLVLDNYGDCIEELMVACMEMEAHLEVFRRRAAEAASDYIWDSALVEELANS